MNSYEPCHASLGQTSVESAQLGAAAAEKSEAAAFRAALETSLIFSHLPADERDWLLEAGEVQRLEAGETVFHCGDPATHVFCVLTGSVGIETSGSGVVLNRLGSGEMFGEIGVIEGRSRTATVRAAEACALLAIDQSDFLGLLVSHPGIGFRLVATLARRLSHLTDFVANFREAAVKVGVA
jgi:CRP-like cAMP-binding protein